MTESDRGRNTRMNRRQFMSRAGWMGAGALAGGPLLAACGENASPSTGDTSAATATTGAGTATGRPIKIGYVSPQTGAIAAFGEADGFVIDGVRSYFADGIDVGGVVHPLEILTKDSQSDPTGAGDAAAELILDDEVDLVVVASTPETTNPVSDQCELNGVPCLSTVAPWQPWFLGRGGDPEVGFTWTYHFFWGLEGLIPQFIALWDAVGAEKVVGGLFPNDGDGQAWGDPEVGFPPALEAAGYELIDPESAVTSPPIRLNIVVLPAPFGPTIPTASPRDTRRDRSSITWSAPNRFERCDSRRMSSPTIGLSVSSVPKVTRQLERSRPSS